MGDTTATHPSLLIEELRSEIRALSERLAHLEALQAHAPVVAPLTGASAPEPVRPPAPEMSPEAAEPISEEILCVIAAAVGAFLGERAHVRQVRLIRSGAWAQQGRVSIQASHHLQH